MNTAEPMQLQINGETKYVADVRTVRDLLASLGLGEKKGMSVEVNMELVPWKLHGSHVLHAGDRVEIVSIVGGG